jgi:hypothetical protein
LKEVKSYELRVESWELRVEEKSSMLPAFYSEDQSEIPRFTRNDSERHRARFLAALGMTTNGIGMTAKELVSE